MHFRKLVKSGKASHVVAIPSSWIRRNQLGTGDIVCVQEESDSSLRITKEARKEAPERTQIVIPIDKKSDHEIRREVLTAYLNNFFYIKLKGRSVPQKLGVLKEYIGQLVAAEVIEQTGELIVIRNFLNIEDTKVDGLIRRIDNITRSMLIDIIEKVDPGVVESIFDRDRDVNKLSWLVFKILRVYLTDPQSRDKAGLGTLDILRFWEAMIHLEKVGDRLKVIAKLLASSANGKGLHERLRPLLKDIQSFQEDTLTAFHQNSPLKANLVSERRNKLLERVQEFALSCKEDEGAILTAKLHGLVMHINDISRIIQYLG